MCVEYLVYHDGEYAASLVMNTGEVLDVIAPYSICIILLIEEIRFNVTKYWMLTSSGHVGWTYHGSAFWVV